MRSLQRMAVAELKLLICRDPALRAAAWAEIKYRNQAKQAFEGENGYRPETKVWTPPTFLPRE